MGRCCGGGCSCKVEGGNNVFVEGIGSSNDPFVISTDVALEGFDTDAFDVSISGNGTLASPWVVSVNYGPGAQLTDLPDVNAVSPTNAHVLGWDAATSKWTPRAPTTAASGSVQHDTSLSGDGSGGSPLQVAEATDGGLTTSGSGVGLNDATKNQLVRKFSNSTTRAAASPAPTLNSLSQLDTNPGVIDYWTGSQWVPSKGPVSVDGVGQQLLALSGAYSAGLPVTMMVRNFSGTTASDGSLTIIGFGAISSRAGVLSANIVVTGSQPYLPIVAAGSDYVYITARRIDDGSALGDQFITGQVTAYVY